MPEISAGVLIVHSFKDRHFFNTSYPRFSIGSSLSRGPTLEIVLSKNGRYLQLGMATSGNIMASQRHGNQWPLATGCHDASCIQINKKNLPMARFEQRTSSTEARYNSYAFPIWRASYSDRSFGM